MYEILIERNGTRHDTLLSLEIKHAFLPGVEMAHSEGNDRKHNLPYPM
ncbi:hypothetical protein [Mucilaginibacter straminoryzae]|nr:hypothetical protein [Mucilaginibacter straminoryzae]